MACKKCDRPDCPTLRALRRSPWLPLSERTRSYYKALKRVQAANDAEWALAYVDCAAHAVDWRAEAMRLRDKVAQMCGPWVVDRNIYDQPCAIVNSNGNLRLHIVPGTVKNAESLPVVLALLNRVESAEAKVAELTEAATANHAGCNKTGCRVCEVLRRHASRGE